MDRRTNHNQPLLSINCPTYNHGPYIRETLESIIAQKTNFQFEILVHDDASTDNTAEIIREYERKYPVLVKPVYQQENKYQKREGIIEKIQHTRALGKYIALCEGDDFWTDPLKLQKQVDFLESNPEFGMVCTDYKRYFQKEDRYQDQQFYRKYPGEVKYEDYILERSTIGTATVMLRKQLLLEYEKKIPESVRLSWIVGDTGLYLYFARFSRIGVLPDITAVYRILENSACHFTDFEEHYKFVKKGYEIPDYFITNFGLSKQALRKMDHNRRTLELKYSCKRRRTGEVLQHFIEILRKDGIYKTDIKIMLNYFGLASIVNILTGRGKRKIYGDI